MRAALSNLHGHCIHGKRSFLASAEHIAQHAAIAGQTEQAILACGYGNQITPVRRVCRADQRAVEQYARRNGAAHRQIIQRYAQPHPRGGVRRRHAALIVQTARRIGAARNPRHTVPALDQAAVRAAGHHRAVRFEPQRIVGRRGNHHNVRPAGHIALTLVVSSNCEHRAVLAQANRMIRAGGNLPKIRPRGHVALTIAVIAHSQRRAVAPAGGGMCVSGGNAPQRPVGARLCERLSSLFHAAQALRVEQIEREQPPRRVRASGGLLHGGLNVLICVGHAEQECARAVFIAVYVGFNGQRAAAVGIAGGAVRIVAQLIKDLRRAGIIVRLPERIGLRILAFEPRRLHLITLRQCRDDRERLGISPRCGQLFRGGKAHFLDRIAVIAARFQLRKRRERALRLAGRDQPPHAAHPNRRQAGDQHAQADHQRRGGHGRIDKYRRQLVLAEHVQSVPRAGHSPTDAAANAPENANDLLRPRVLLFHGRPLHGRLSIGLTGRGARGSLIGIHARASPHSSRYLRR